MIKRNLPYIIFIFIMIAITITMFVGLTGYLNIASISAQSSAKGMVVIDKTSKRILNEKNAFAELPMASTTKIFTTIFAIEKAKDLNQMVKVDDSAVGIEGTSMYLKYGEELPLIDLLYGVIVPSGNDACVAVACHISGSEEQFVDEMNEFIVNLGCKNTHLTNSHGLDQEGHYTCAYDLALITSYALDNEIFSEIVSTKQKVIKETNKYQTRYLTNKNKLLNMMDNCIGVKIGFTDNAGRCLVSACKTSSNTYICVVLNCYDMFNESKLLLEQAQNAFKNKCIVKPYNIVAVADIKDGKQDKLKVYNKTGFEYPLTQDEANMLDIKVKLLDNLTAPINKDDIMGKIEVYKGDTMLFETEIFAYEDVECASSIGIIQQIIKNWA